MLLQVASTLGVTACLMLGSSVLHECADEILAMKRRLGSPDGERDSLHALLGRPLPGFSAQLLYEAGRRLRSRDLRGNTATLLFVASTADRATLIAEAVRMVHIIFHRFDGVVCVVCSSDADCDQLSRDDAAKSLAHLRVIVLEDRQGQLKERLHVSARSWTSITFDPSGRVIKIGDGFIEGVSA